MLQCAHQKIHHTYTYPPTPTPTPIVEEYSKARGFCKVTLECLANNTPAMNAYVKQGFKAYELSPEMGTATFFHKYV